MDIPQIIAPFLELPDVWLYLLLGGFALLENVLPPVPGDAVVIFGGYLAGLGRLSLPITFVVVTLGSWGGFMVYYALGRWAGRTSIHERLGRWITPEALERGEAWVRRRGLWVVLANRLLAGARSVISIAAGFAGMPVATVGAAALLGAALWDVLLVGGGYVVGEEWERGLELLGAYNRAVVVVLTLGGALIALRYWRRRTTRSTAGIKNP